jgi:hypothetical protein
VDQYCWLPVGFTCSSYQSWSAAHVAATPSNVKVTANINAYALKNALYADGIDMLGEEKTPSDM